MSVPSRFATSVVSRFNSSGRESCQANGREFSSRPFCFVGDQWLQTLGHPVPVSFSSRLGEITMSGAIYNEQGSFAFGAVEYFHPHSERYDAIPLAMSDADWRIELSDDG